MCAQLVRRLSVAPMLDWTDPHFRHFLRLVSRHSRLYTEMHVVNKLLHLDTQLLHRHVGRPEEAYAGPLALQIGGNDPTITEAAVRRLWNEGYNFDEVNLNVGCPSDRVSGKGSFGAVLMDDPAAVAALARGVKEGLPSSSPTQVTVKCRIGLARPSDFLELEEKELSVPRHVQQESQPGFRTMLKYFQGDVPEDFLHSRLEKRFSHLCDFVTEVSTQAPVTHFVVHAREAAIQCKLNPKRNRSVPPLCYDTVHRLQEEFPHLSFGINGGFTDYNDIQEQLRRLDSVMVGRAVMDNSFFLQHADRLIFDDAEAPIVNEADELQHRVDILSQYGEYADGQWPKTPLHALLKPVINSFPQVPGSKMFRRTMGEAHKQTRKMPPSEVIQQAIQALHEVSEHAGEIDAAGVNLVHP